MQPCSAVSSLLLLVLVTVAPTVAISSYTVCQLESVCDFTSIGAALQSPNLTSGDVVEVLGDVHETITLGNSDTPFIPPSPLTLLFNASGGITVYNWNLWFAHAALTLSGLSPLTMIGGSFTMAVNATLIQNVPMTQFNATQPTMAILGSGLWLQNASAVFLQPPSISTATSINVQGTWIQKGQCNMTSTNSYAVFVGGGVWHQYDLFWADFAAGDNSEEPAIGILGTWYSEAGSLTILNITGGGGIGIVMGNWYQSGPVIITVTGSGANALQLSSGFYWQQTAPVNITVAMWASGLFITTSFFTWTSTSVCTINTIEGYGISLTYSGGFTDQSIFPDQASSIIIVLQSSISMGVSCGGYSTCCNRLVTPPLSSSMVVSGIGEQSDCTSTSLVSASGTTLQPSPVMLINSSVAFQQNTTGIVIQGFVASPEGFNQALLTLKNPYLMGPSWSVGSSTATKDTNATTHTYQSHYSTGGGDINSTLVMQSFTYFFTNSSANQQSFLGYHFDVTPTNLKWSINITSPGNNTSASEAQFPSTVMSYEIDTRLTPQDVATIIATGESVIQALANTPYSGITTYFLVLGGPSASLSFSQGLLVAQVEVFDYALTEGGMVVPIEHKVTYQVSSINASVGAFELELVFPSFNQSLSYDPIIGISTLLAVPDEKGSGSNNIGLIIGTAVILPLALIVVAVASMISVFLAYRRNKSRVLHIKQRLMSVS